MYSPNRHGRAHTHTRARSDIKHANTVRNLGVCLDPTLSFQQQISSVCRICYLELRRISAIRHCLSEDVTQKTNKTKQKTTTVVCVCSFKTRSLQLTHLWRAVLSIFFLNSKKYRTVLQDSFLEQPDLPTSLLCFILFTGYLLSRGSNTNCLCFALRLFLTGLPSAFQNFFTFTLFPGSSALLQAPECSEYHPSEQSHVVSALSLTKLQLSGTNSLFLSAVLPLSALLNLS